MKKIVLLLVVVNGLLLAGIIFLLKTKVEEEPPALQVEFSTVNDLMQFVLNRGDFEDVIESTGVCLSEEDAKTMDFFYNTKYELIAQKGQDYNLGDVVAIIDGNEEKCTCNCRILDIQIEQKEIQIQYFDYDTTWIEASIPEEELEAITYNTVCYLVSGEEKYDAVIEQIGWQIENGRVGIRLRTKERLLPGKEVRLLFVRKVYKDVVTIRNEFILEDNLGTYVYTLDDTGTYSKVYFEVKKAYTDYSIIQIEEGYANGIMYTERSFN